MSNDQGFNSHPTRTKKRVLRKKFPKVDDAGWEQMTDQQKLCYAIDYVDTMGCLPSRPAKFLIDLVLQVKPDMEI